MGLRCRSKRGLQKLSSRKIFVLLWLIMAAGAVMNGWDVVGKALRPGTTVSAPVIVALIALFGIGALLGGLLLAIPTRPRRRPPARPSGSRPRSVISADALLCVIVIGGQALFEVLDLILVTPGETVSVGLSTRLLAIGCGIIVGAAGAESIVDADVRTPIVGDSAGRK